MKKTKIKRVMSAFLSVLMGTMMMPIAESTAATVYTENITSSQDGYDFELWKDYGNTSMELTGSNGGFKCSWDNIGNALFRTGKKWSGTYPQWQSLNGIEMEYEADYRPNGNSYLSVYGWTKAPLVEYYIIESWGTWRPPGDQGYKGTITVDGAKYDVYETLRVNQPSIEGNTTFPQYFSVRQEGDKSTSGTVSVSEHFEAWEEQLGLEMGGMYEVSLVVEGYQSSGSATVSKNILTFGGGDKDNTTTTPTNPPVTVEPDENGYYLNCGFESGMDKWSARGDNSVARDSDSYAAGSNSLYVSDRTEAWNGAGYTLDAATFVPGNSYSFSTMVMQNEISSEDFKLSLQYDDASGETQYATVAEAAGAKGKWTQLANTSFTIPAGASNMLLYVETAENLTSFYMDEAIAAPDGTKIAAATNGVTGSNGNNDNNDDDNNNNNNTPSSDSLKDAFASCFKLGTSVSPHVLSTGGDFIKKHFNSITPENELKPEAIIDQTACQQKGNNVNTQVNLSRAAQTLKFCEDNNIGVRGHTFVWYSQTPDWFFRENFSSNGNYVTPEIMDQRLESFIKNTFDAIATQYPNLDLYAYDVCNELFLNDGGGMRGADNSGWMKVYGDDSFVIKAFQYARKYAPAGCKLYINDYNEYIPAKTNDIYNMAMKLKELGVIDGIGMQSHLATNYPSASVYKTALEKFISTGLDVQITELDITCTDFDEQAKLYKEIFQLAVDNKDSISCLTVWGTNDSISWRKDQNPLLFSQGYQPKPAYDAVMQVAGNLPQEPAQTTTTEATTTKATTTTTTTTVTTTKDSEKPTSSTTTTVDTNKPTATDYGDVNCDGKVNVLDVIVLNKSLLSGEELSKQGEVNADVDLDGTPTVADSLTILKFMISLVDKLPISA